MMTPSPDSQPASAPAPRPPIAVLPLGAHEQHGPHLPFETDTLIAEGIAGRLKTALPAGLPVTFLPAESVGYSIEHMDVEGTKTLAFDEAVNRWLGIAERLAEQKIRKFVMLNAHGGNSPLMTIVATEARIRFAMLAVATSWTRFGLPDGVIRPQEKAIGIHGGDIETSVMLALHPDKSRHGGGGGLPLPAERICRALQTSARLRAARFRLEDVGSQPARRGGQRRGRDG